MAKQDKGVDVEIVEWRLSGAARWLPLAYGVVSTAVAVLNLAFGDHGLILIVEVAVGGLGVVLIVYVLRVRVRATESGVEMRVFRVRTIAYTGIQQVRLNRFTGYSTLNLVRFDGSIVAPPAPRAAGVSVMSAAVEAIEYRRLLAGGADCR